MVGIVKEGGFVMIWLIAYLTLGGVGSLYYLIFDQGYIKVIDILIFLVISVVYGPLLLIAVCVDLRQNGKFQSSWCQAAR